MDHNFIEDYLQNPSHAVSAACAALSSSDWCGNVDEETIYSQLASPEFRLYQEMIFSEYNLKDLC